MIRGRAALFPSEAERAKLKAVTVKEHIAEIRAMLNSVGAATVYHDDKIEAHDRQIAELIRLADKQGARIADLVRATENLERQWQAYINTLPKQ